MSSGVIEHPLLEVENIVKTFHSGSIYKRKSIQAVDNVSFELPKEKGVTTCLAGESGSGKTTIARLVLGLTRPTSGEISYKGKDIWRMNRAEKAIYRREVQMVAQDPFAAFNPFYEVEHILEVPIRKFKLASSKSETREMINKIFEAVNLRPGEIQGKYPHQLSGGERQRVVLARSLLLRPRIVVADEPVSMIDMSTRANILNIVNSLRNDYGISFLYITHDLSTATYVSDDMIILYRGQVVERGKTSSVINKSAHPYVRILLDCIPIPDPDKRQRKKIKLDTSVDRVKTDKSCCRFHQRCSQVMDVCKKSRPPLISLDQDHQVACHLCSI